jgi:hypothetical protein
VFESFEKIGGQVARVQLSNRTEMKPNLAAEFVRPRERRLCDGQLIQPAGVDRIEQNEQRNFLTLRSKPLRYFIGN